MATVRRTCDAFVGQGEKRWIVGQAPAHRSLISTPREGNAIWTLLPYQGCASYRKVLQARVSNAKK